MYVLIVEAQDQSCVIRVALGSQPGSSFCSPKKCVTLFKVEYCVVTASFWKKSVAFLK